MKHCRLTFLAAAVCFLTSLSAWCQTAPACGTQDPALQASANSISARACLALDDAFNIYLKSCSLASPLKIGKDDKHLTRSASVIPSQLVDQVKRYAPSDSIYIDSHVSLGRVLSQVFSAPALAGDENHFIAATAGSASSDLFQLNAESAVYSTNCESTIAANLNVDGQYGIPIVQVKASLDASLKGGNKSGLLISSGKFDSPLYTLSQVPFPLYPQMLEAKWRIDNSNQEGALYYLPHVTALASSQISTAEYYSNLAVGADASASTIVLSGKINASVQKDITNKLSASFYNTVVKTPVASEFASIPTLTVLKGLIAGMQQPRPDPSAAQLIRTTDIVTVTENLLGVPPEMCNGSFTHWTITDSVTLQTDWRATPADPKVDVIDPDDKGVPGCKIAFGVQNSGVVAKSFTATPQLNATYKSQTFTFNLLPIAFTASDFPRFSSRQQYDPTGKDKTVNGLQVREFTVILPIEQSATVDGPTSAVWTPTRISATCPNGSSIFLLPATAAFVVNPRNVTYVPVNLQYDLSDAGGILDTADPSPLTCTLSTGELKFQDAGGTTLLALPSTLGLHITVPHVKPALQKPVLQPTTPGKYTITGLISNMNNPDLLKSSSFTLFDGTTSLGFGTVNGLTVTFPPVVLDPSTSHDLHYESTATTMLSAATSAVTNGAKVQ